ncbi:putative signal transducing protein [Syntrophus aciditrophicus]|uniref:Hypothetical cytosolic protein n=1 Tax=Syntrophus aciditrophicus (strain SB) TaxID=56780 RepID=Q2LR01_SYNAS|nr:DUF2007 domain-containing protein [Syntrophus aciditrophicus]ABC76515.1 hypothetical cytosolic protein [Syntrophus aciditrophicus SB]
MGKEMIHDEKWRVVCVASGMINAHIIEGRLKAEGIATRLSYEIAGVLYATTVDGLGEVKILVPETDLERAQKALEQSYKDDDLS